MDAIALFSTKTHSRAQWHVHKQPRKPNAFEQLQTHPAHMTIHQAHTHTRALHTDYIRAHTRTQTQNRTSLNVLGQQRHTRKHAYKLAAMYYKSILIHHTRTYVHILPHGWAHSGTTNPSHKHNFIQLNTHKHLENQDQEIMPGGARIKLDNMEF